MILFHRPLFEGNERKYLEDVFQNMHLKGDGSYTKKCNLFLESALGCSKVLLTTSCTHALEMSAILLNIQNGDEVIVPSFTFTSTASAFAIRGAKIVFCDVRKDTINIDETKLESLITDKTKAIVPVHYAGIACEMETILDIAKNNGIHVVEDNAHGLFGKYKDKFLGTIGTFGTQSFHESKNFTSGEGGALLINDPSYILNAEIVREKGTNRSKFFRGQVDKYTWVDHGSSYLPSDILAALLLAQLERHTEIQSKRKEIWDSYMNGLSSWAEANGVKLPHVPNDCLPGYHLFYMVFKNGDLSKKFFTHLKENNINADYHYAPLHQSEMGQKFGSSNCPVIESFWEGLIRLPFHNNLSDDEILKVIDVTKKFCC